MPPQVGPQAPAPEFINRHDEHPFICGGAFAGSTRSSIADRRKGVGFGANVASREDKDIGELFSGVLPEDLLKFG